ncbi:hypothetical protein VE04_02873 [Pseudogymnoascus sp. 24MN13]|nr:hypothetical protein VE04_02873 [Pseudogymnoascus sp. 24MN13]
MALMAPTTQSSVQKRLFIFLLLLGSLQFVKAQDCSKANPCAVGCCSKFGYCGIGPDFCEDEVCVDTCNYKAQCDPGFGLKWAESSKCRLNVCCSKYGFCGTTQDFCGDKKVEKKSCDKDGNVNRVVGYFEGWATRRGCNAFFPEQIPRGVYSIINFAFATIDPVTFEVIPASEEDIPLYRRLAALKSDDPTLQTYIAIGGWTFNDEGSGTERIFGNIASSEENQKKFFKSLVAFLSKYDFNGVDLDWEYPEAPDRSGKGEDYVNFPKFMTNLKAAISQTAGRGGLSITLPASYWYLQHFNLVELKKSIDFFNIMSYDLHGTWDKGSNWTEPWLNPHTNVTEIDGALDLLWRNDIDPSKVVLGLAFYARAYTLADLSCTSKNCKFASAARAGPCSREAGILLNSEIDDIVKEKGLKPVLWEKEMVKMVHWDDQWLTYDDADTLKLKAKYARSLCLGGLMVWAISHDTRNAKYSLALAAAANRKILMQRSIEGPTQEVKIPHPQCKWSNCLEGCPADWQTMKRKDSRAGKDEWMFDDSGCDGAGIHRLCCPSSEKAPTCGWYDLPKKGGNCDQTCPAGTREVGSNSKYCDKNYQAACCTVDDDKGELLPALKLYENCDWAQAPMCDLGMCTFAGSMWPTELVDSSTGSGGARCNARSYDVREGTMEVQERKYCCDQSNKNRKWSSCTWEKYGRGSAGARCYPNCPGSKTRVAMDTWGDGCKSRGARAYCCDADLYDLETRPSDYVQEYRDAMKSWMDSPTCPSATYAISKRGDQVPIGGGKTVSAKVLWLLTYILAAAYQVGRDTTAKALFSAWDEYINGTKWDVMQSVSMISFVTDKIRYPPFDPDGPSGTARRFLCQPDVTTALISPKAKTIICNKDMCGIDGLCFDDFDEDAPGSSNQPGIGFGNTRRNTFTSPVEPRAGELEKRDDVRKWKCKDANHPNGVEIKYQKAPHTSAGQWDTNDPIYDNTLTWLMRDHCSMTTFRQAEIDGVTYFATEHIVEVQTMNMFFDYLLNEDNDCLVDCDFFLEFFNKKVLTYAPAMQGGFNSEIPSERIMEALGSEENTQNFVLLQEDLNGMKARIWRHVDPVSDNTWGDMVSADSPALALQAIRNTIMVFNYLNHAHVRPKFKAINGMVRDELKRAQEAYNYANDAEINLVNCWDLFFAELIDQMVVNGKTWVNRAISAMRTEWRQSNYPTDTAYQAEALEVNQHLDQLETSGITNSEIHFDTSDMY